MKYLKRYEKFVNENIKFIGKNIDRNLLIVEKKVLNDFSISFWDMSLKSSVFSVDEKNFIKENLLNVKVDLINERWLTDTLGEVWNKAKEVGGKIWDKVQSKITIIKDNIKNLCSGISDFIKDMFKSIGNSIITKSQALKDVVKGDFPKKVEEFFQKNKPKDEDLGNELEQLSATISHLNESVKAGLFVKNVDTSDDSVINGAESEVSELESELKTESIRHDILSAFYIKEDVEYKVGDKVKYKRDKGEEVEKKISRIDGDTLFFKDKQGNEFSKSKSDIIGKSVGTGAKSWAGFAKWFLDMEQATPPEKGKAIWWIKLILKIVTLILSPIVKALEVAAKYVASNILKVASAVSKYLNGPGVFEFLVLGGIVAGIPALVVEFKLVSHKMPEPWAHIFEIVSHFLAELQDLRFL